MHRSQLGLIPHSHHNANGTPNRESPALFGSSRGYRTKEHLSSVTLTGLVAGEGFSSDETFVKSQKLKTAFELSAHCESSYSGDVL